MSTNPIIDSTLTLLANTLLREPVIPAVPLLFPAVAMSMFLIPFLWMSWLYAPNPVITPIIPSFMSSSMPYVLFSSRAVLLSMAKSIIVPVIDAIARHNTIMLENLGIVIRSRESSLDDGNSV
ncbi:hypothetical protein HRbin04_01080 [archaeon HR04]|nr:hypothetical protein HRbin04_01080 [archaeon HR04]